MGNNVNLQRTKLNNLADAVPFEPCFLAASAVSARVGLLAPIVRSRFPRSNVDVPEGWCDHHESSIGGLGWERPCRAGAIVSSLAHARLGSLMALVVYGRLGEAVEQQPVSDFDEHCKKRARILVHLEIAMYIY